VAAVSIHMSVSIRGTSVRHQDRYLMNRFWGKTQEIPEHIWTWEMGLWVSFLGMNKIWEFHGISYEEYRSIISDHIPVSFFGVKFNGKSSWISSGISWSIFTSDCRKSWEDRSSFSNSVKEFGFAIFRNVVSYFKISVSSSTFSVDNPFWDSFSIEVRNFINQVKIL